MGAAAPATPPQASATRARAWRPVVERIAKPLGRRALSKPGQPMHMLRRLGAGTILADTFFTFARERRSVPSDHSIERTAR
jgi:hypothetical protein